ncbi:hypothetical protein H9M94_00480 [Mycoplasma sp. Pen4]|uniref:M60 family metallopeptidase n=1 Tax=Mycoplasma sp. Pen4 TaxID=640330 RepID=UPI00165447A1|nr:M60 family metallopeptidase [Mycoplasma sp. Pen4]QNM93740.1 hypothetical protein H9M94_00480 [Mycoplasma sp. Pen4]
MKKPLSKKQKIIIGSTIGALALLGGVTGGVLASKRSQSETTTQTNDYEKQIDELNYISEGIKERYKEQINNLATNEEKNEFLKNIKKKNMQVKEFIDFFNSNKDLETRNNYKFADKSKQVQLNAIIDEKNKNIQDDKLLDDAFDFGNLKQNFLTRLSELNGDENLEKVFNEIDKLDGFASNQKENIKTKISNSNSLSDAHKKLAQYQDSNNKLNVIKIKIQDAEKNLKSDIFTDAAKEELSSFINSTKARINDTDIDVLNFDKEANDIEGAIKKLQDSIQDEDIKVALKSQLITQNNIKTFDNENETITVELIFPDDLDIQQVEVVWFKNGTKVENEDDTYIIIFEPEELTINVAPQIIYKGKTVNLNSIILTKTPWQNRNKTSITNKVNSLELSDEIKQELNSRIESSISKEEALGVVVLATETNNLFNVIATDDLKDDVNYKLASIDNQNNLNTAIENISALKIEPSNINSTSIQNLKSRYNVAKNSLNGRSNLQNSINTIDELNNLSDEIKATGKSLLNESNTLQGLNDNVDALINQNNVTKTAFTNLEKANEIKELIAKYENETKTMIVEKIKSDWEHSLNIIENADFIDKTSKKLLHNSDENITTLSEFNRLSEGIIKFITNKNNLFKILQELILTNSNDGYFVSENEPVSVYIDNLPKDLKFQISTYKWVVDEQVINDLNTNVITFAPAETTTNHDVYLQITGSYDTESFTDFKLPVVVVHKFRLPDNIINPLKEELKSLSALDTRIINDFEIKLETSLTSALATQVLNEAKELNTNAMQLAEIYQRYSELDKNANNYKFSTPKIKTDLTVNIYQLEQLLDTTKTKLIIKTNKQQLMTLKSDIERLMNSFNGDANFTDINSKINKFDYLSNNLIMLAQSEIKTASDYENLDSIYQKWNGKNQQTISVISILNDDDNLQNQISSYESDVNNKLIPLELKSDYQNKIQKANEILEQVQNKDHSVLNNQDTNIQEIFDQLLAAKGKLTQFINENLELKNALNTIRVSASNNGEFDDNNTNIVVSLNQENKNPDLNVTNIKWYVNDSLLNSQPSFNKDQTLEDKKVYALISGSYKNQTFSDAKTNVITILPATWANKNKDSYYNEIASLSNLDETLRNVHIKAIMNSANQETADQILNDAKTQNDLVSKIIEEIQRTTNRNQEYVFSKPEVKSAYDAKLNELKTLLTTDYSKLLVNETPNVINELLSEIKRISYSFDGEQSVSELTRLIRENRKLLPNNIKNEINNQIATLNDYNTFIEFKDKAISETKYAQKLAKLLKTTREMGDAIKLKNKIANNNSIPNELKEKLNNAIQHANDKFDVLHVEELFGPSREIKQLKDFNQDYEEELNALTTVLTEVEKSISNLNDANLVGVFLLNNAISDSFGYADSVSLSIKKPDYINVSTARWIVNGKELRTLSFSSSAKLTQALQSSVYQRLGAEVKVFISGTDGNGRSFNDYVLGPITIHPISLQDYNIKNQAIISDIDNFTFELKNNYKEQIKNAKSFEEIDQIIDNAKDQSKNLQPGGRTSFIFEQFLTGSIDDRKPYIYASEDLKQAQTVALSQLLNLLNNDHSKFAKYISKKGLEDIRNNIYLQKQNLDGDDNFNQALTDILIQATNLSTDLQNKINDELLKTNSYSSLRNKVTDIISKSNDVAEINSLINKTNQLLNNIDVYNNQTNNIIDLPTNIKDDLSSKLSVANSILDNRKLNSFDANTSMTKENLANVYKRTLSIYENHKFLNNALHSANITVSNNGNFMNKRTPVTFTLLDIPGIRISNYDWYVNNSVSREKGNQLNIYFRTASTVQNVNKLVLSGSYKDVTFTDFELPINKTVTRPAKLDDAYVNEKASILDAEKYTNVLVLTVIQKLKNDIKDEYFETSVEEILNDANLYVESVSTFLSIDEEFKDLDNPPLDMKYAPNELVTKFLNQLNSGKKLFLNANKTKFSNPFITALGVSIKVNELKELRKQLNGEQRLNDALAKIGTYTLFDTVTKAQMKDEIAKTENLIELEKLENKYQTINDNADLFKNKILELLANIENTTNGLAKRIEEHQSNNPQFPIPPKMMELYQNALQTAKNSINPDGTINNILQIEQVKNDLEDSYNELEQYLIDKDRILTILNAARIELMNNGYSIANAENFSAKLILDDEVSLYQFQWFTGDKEIYNTNSKTPTIPLELINLDQPVSLLISGYLNKVSFADFRITSDLTFKVNNPLRNITISASNNATLVNNQATIIASSNDASLSYQWYFYGHEIDGATSPTLNATQVGPYKLLIKNSDNVEWYTNEVYISSLELVNNQDKFRLIASKNITFNNGYIEDLEYVTRTPNDNFYETDLLRDYGKYGFKYPAWNYNYEADGNRRSFLDINGVRTNISNLVLEEKVPGTKLKFNDPWWIKEQIRNGTLKQHPAAKEFYQRKITPDTKSLTRRMGISADVYGVYNTGIYAVPGEVVEIQFSSETIKRFKRFNRMPITVIINQNYWDNRPFNDSGRISNRYPFLQSTFRFDLNEIDSNRTIKVASPFGGPISLSIDADLNYGNDNSAIYDLTIKNGIEMLAYFDGKTTKEDWDAQIQKIKNGELNAPEMAIQTQYASILVPWTGDNAVGYEKLDRIVYPGEVMKKWNSFYEGSFKWNRYTAPYLRLNYCDDIWGGAGAWGGGNNLYAPTSWGGTYLRGNVEFSFQDWGNYHEVNHNFQNNQDPFNIRDHGWTNTVSTINLSYINDTNRWRSFKNLNGEHGWGWSYLSNPFINIKHGTNWYALYASMIYSLGQDRFIDWTEWSAQNGHHDKGFETVQALSDYFKLDFVHPFKARNWSSKLTDSISDLTPRFEAEIQNIKNQQKRLSDRYEVLSAQYAEGIKKYEDNSPEITNRDEFKVSLDAKVEEMRQIEIDIRLLNININGVKQKIEAEKQKQIEIKKINKKYTAFDFVGNLYASGQYFYNSQTRAFSYEEDTTAAFQIPAGEDYVFDFEHGINSPNQNFRWSKIKFNKNSKLGGTLTVDPNNPKKVIYHANPNSLDQIDEFDVEITPDEFDGKPENYVPSYKWKIKVRNVVNRPVYYIYDTLPNNVNSIDEAVNKANELVRLGQISVVKTPADHRLNAMNYLNNKNRQLVQYKMKWTPDETGDYDIMARFDDYFMAKINGEVVFRQNRWTSRPLNIRTYHFEKGKYYDIEFNAYNVSSAGSFDVWLKKGDKTYPIDKNTLSDTIANVTTDHNKWAEYATDPKYNYKRRYYNSEVKDKSQVAKFWNWSGTLGEKRMTHIIGINNPEIKYYGDWDFDKNQYNKFNSNVNNLTAVTNGANNYFEYEFEGKQISIFGKRSTEATNFDVYIDGKLISTNSTNSDDVKYNSNLFTYVLTQEEIKSGKHTIKVKNKQNKPLAITFLGILK